MLHCLSTGLLKLKLDLLYIKWRSLLATLRSGWGQTLAGCSSPQFIHTCGKGHGGFRSHAPLLLKGKHGPLGLLGLAADVDKPLTAFCDSAGLDICLLLPAC